MNSVQNSKTDKTGSENHCLSAIKTGFCFWENIPVELAEQRSMRWQTVETAQTS